MIGWLMNNELQSVWKEEVVAWSKTLPRHFGRGTPEYHGKPQGVLSPVQNLNPGLFEYGATVLSLTGICNMLTIMLPLVLYGCKTWSLTLREEHRLRVFENRMLRGIFGPKRDEVTGEWRKLHCGELHTPSVVWWLACLPLNPQDILLRVQARPRTVDFYGW
jgi:hypothetical protein